MKGVLAIAASLSLGVRLGAQCPDAAARTPPVNSVAVLYLDNLSRDTTDAFLADGLTEEIIIRLGQVQRLNVKSRFEVQRFRGRTTSLDAGVLGRSLNAAYLVTWYLSTLLYQRQFDTAAAFVERLGPIVPPADRRPMRGWLLAQQGDLRRALPLLNWHYHGGQYAGTYVCALVAQGDSAAARATIESMLAARTSGYYNPLALARAYAAMGDLDRGVEWLSRAFEERTIWLLYVRVDPELEPLRADPRYAALDSQLRY